MSERLQRGPVPTEGPPRETVGTATEKVCCRYHGNQFTRRDVLRAVMLAGSFGSAARRAGVDSQVAWRELQDFVREVAPPAVKA
jgi:hypothetical protein